MEEEEGFSSEEEEIAMKAVKALEVLLCLLIQQGEKSSFFAGKTLKGLFLDA